MKQKIISWLKRESAKPYMIPLLGFVAFIESIIFPVPVDIFTLALSAAQPKKWFIIATTATISSVLGGVAAYFIGAYFFDSIGIQIIEFFHLQSAYQEVLVSFNRGVFLVMFASAFTPLPYKLFTLAGGALNVALLPFILASLLGRGLRFYIESYVPYRYGEAIGKRFYKIFNRATILLILVIVAIILVKKYLL